ncbi:MAG: DUF5330 domain-containing protein [Pseudomonadota bacterium]
MKALLKLAIVLFVIALAMPFLRPGSPVSAFVNAAMVDVGGFCQRQPAACAKGLDAVRQSTAFIREAIASANRGSPSQQPLTPEDRGLAPVAITAGEQQSLAGHGAR